MKKPRKEAGGPKQYYHISSVARMYNIHPQTLRLYEREGLLTPSRSEGNTRLYSSQDIKQLEIVLNLIRDLGVNLAGVEVILNMRRRMEQIEAEVSGFLEEIQREFFRGREEEFASRAQSLVQVSPARLVKVEKADK